MISIKNQTKIALLYFLIAALFGVFLRSLHVFDIDVNYKFIVHGHSHVALLGWIYLGLTTLFYKCFIEKNAQSKRKQYRIFLFTQCTLLGMMVTFPFQGYAFLSILFSTLFLFVSYWFVWFFFKNVASEVKKSTSYLYIKASLIYLVVSSIGPWALGGIMTTLGPSSVWYRLSIYFYLHFQYNGWMLLAIIGLFLYVFERKGITLSRKQNKLYFIGVNISVLLTFFLSTLWTEPSSFIFGLSFLGASLQLICFLYALFWIRNKRITSPSFFSNTERFLLKTILFLLGIKVILQLLGSTPYFAQLGAMIIEFTIAYLHGVFLGFTSLSLFFVLHATKIIIITRKTLILYLLGFFLTEGLLFYKGLIIWLGTYPLSNYYNEFLLIASCILLLGIASLFLTNSRNKS